MDPPLRSLAFVMSVPIGGPARLLFTMGKEFIRRGLDVHMISLRPCVRPVEREGRDRLLKIGFQVWEGTGGRYKRQQQWLADHLRAHPVDLLYCNTSASTAFVALPAAQALGIPSLFHQQGHFGENVKHYTGGGLRDVVHFLWSVPVRFYIRPFIALADVVAVVSRSGLELNRQWPVVCREECVILPNVIEQELLPPAPSAEEKASLREELGVAGADPLIVSTSVLMVRKAIDVLLRAMPAILERHPRARLLLCGDGPERENLERLATQLGLQETARFLGHRSDVLRVLQIGDLFVLIPMEDMCPNGLLEAMACRLPIVATSVGGIPEMVEDGKHALLIPPRSVAGTAEAICRLAEDAPLASRLAEAASVHVKEAFSAEAVADRYFAAFEQALQEHARRRGGAGLRTGVR